MRILLVSDFYPPSIGGTEQHVQGLATKLVEQKHQVIVATTGRPSFSKAEGMEPAVYKFEHSLSRLPVAFSDTRYKFIAPLSDPIFAENLSKLIGDFRPDIIHAHGWSMFTASKVAKSRRVPVVATLHDYGFFCPKRTLYVERSSSLCPLLGKDRLRISLQCVGCSVESYGLRAPIMPMLMKYSSSLLSNIQQFIAVSSYVKQVAERSSLSPVSCIPNFIDTKVVRATTMYKESDNVGVLFLGTLARHKGVEVLLKAFRELCRRGLKIQLTMVGRSFTGFDVRPPPEVKMIRDATYNQTLNAIASSKILVIPSIWPEPFGIVALEGMAFSKPIIASQSGGLVDLVIPEKNGLLVPPGDATSLADAISELYFDDDRIERMGLYGNQYLKEMFDTEVVIPRIEQVYQKAIEGKSEKDAAQSARFDL